MALAQSTRGGQFPSVCHLCEISPDIEWKCLDCDLLMCPKCKDKIHVKIKNANRHRIVDIKDIGKIESDIEFTKLKCEEHSALICLFCKSCDTLVCPTCVAKGHKKHELTEISEGYKQKLGIVMLEKFRIEVTISELNNNLSNLEQLKFVLDNRMTREEKKIEDHRKALKKAVDTHVDKLISDLRQDGKEVFNEVDKDINTVQKALNKVHEKDTELKQLMTTSNAKNFFKDFSEVKTSNDTTELPAPSLLRHLLTFQPKDITVSQVGELHLDSGLLESLKIELNISEQYKTQLSGISHLCPCADSSMWICNTTDKVVQKVKPVRGNLKVLSTINTSVYGMAAIASNDLLVSIKGESRLKQISSKTGKMMDTKYDVTPLVASAIHITRDEKVIVGGNNEEQDRGGIVVMDNDGSHERIIELDNNRKSLFIYPNEITSSLNGNIQVLDCCLTNKRGRVVVLTKRGEICNIYYGHPEVNEDLSFFPIGITRTPEDNLIIVDLHTRFLHILDNMGHLLTIYNTNNAGIVHPYSLAFTSNGSLWIGSTVSKRSETKDAQLYQVILSGQ